MKRISNLLLRCFVLALLVSVIAVVAQTPDIKWYTDNPEAESFEIADFCAGVTPVPIPNTEVKPCRADGTAW